MLVALMLLAAVGIFLLVEKVWHQMSGEPCQAPQCMPAKAISRRERLSAYILPFDASFWQCVEAVPISVHHVQELVRMLTRGYVSMVGFVMLCTQSLW